MMQRNATSHLFVLSSFALRLSVVAVACGLAFANNVYAADASRDKNKTSKPEHEWVQSLYIGAGIQNSLISLNAEAITPYANVYTKLGAFYPEGSPAIQIGFRKPYLITGENGDKDGYYMGAFIGHAASSSYTVSLVNSDNETKYKKKSDSRLGVGAELSYVWQNKIRLNAASVSIAYLQGTTVNSGKEKLDSEPTIMFGYTFQMNIF